MANLSLVYQWGKHQSITVEIFAEDSFPDALDEACSQAIRTMRGTLADICTAEGKAE